MSRPLARPGSRRRSGFTLLEVLLALGILSIGMMVLVESQATALWMSVDADKTTVATMLAQEKMLEAQIVLEGEGWTDQDIEEDGDFDDFGDEEFRGDSLHLDKDALDLDEFQWAYTVRKIELTIPTDLGGVADQLAGSGMYGEAETEAMDEQDAEFDLTDLGITPDMLADYLGDYVREVRVLVWWGDNADGTDQIELVSHVINPTGAVTELEDQGIGSRE